VHGRQPGQHHRRRRPADLSLGGLSLTHTAQRLTPPGQCQRPEAPDIAGQRPIPGHLRRGLGHPVQPQHPHPVSQVTAQPCREPGGLQDRRRQAAPGLVTSPGQQPVGQPEVAQHGRQQQRRRQLVVQRPVPAGQRIDVPLHQPWRRTRTVHQLCRWLRVGGSGWWRGQGRSDGQAVGGSPPRHFRLTLGLGLTCQALPAVVAGGGELSVGRTQVTAGGEQAVGSGPELLAGYPVAGLGASHSGPGPAQPQAELLLSQASLLAQAGEQISQRLPERGKLV
jgi:hypothetical protein